MTNTRLTLSPSPHIFTADTVQSTMLHVLIALIPAVACALYFFRLPALAVLAVCVGCCVLTEWAVTRFMLRRRSTISDCSAIVTGVLLALNLPAGLPLWMAAAGSVVAIGVAKMAFGGLGCNIFNPALVGRVFLLISFPVAMTTWPLPSLIGNGIDASTGATVLTLIENGSLHPAELQLSPMLLGMQGGSMGEVSAIAIAAGLIYLLATGIIRIDIPAAVVLGMVGIDLIAGFPPVVDILSGGLLLGAVFMATDYTTSPMTTRGRWLYGLLIGIITACIRRWGAYPEGMSFAILIMNGATPLINRYIKPKRYSISSKTA